jgi:hypothetical protein
MHDASVSHSLSLCARERAYSYLYVVCVCVCVHTRKHGTMNSHTVTQRIRHIVRRLAVKHEALVLCGPLREGGAPFSFSSCVRRLYTLFPESASNVLEGAEDARANILEGAEEARIWRIGSAYALLRPGASPQEVRSRGANPVMTIPDKASDEHRRCPTPPPISLLLPYCSSFSLPSCRFSSRGPALLCSVGEVLKRVASGSKLAMEMSDIDDARWSPGQDGGRMVAPAPRTCSASM